MARNFVAASSQYLIRSTGIPSAPCTMACWFRANDVDNLYTVLEANSTSDSKIYLSLSLGGIVAGDPVGFASRAGAAERSTTTTTGYTANTWNHACGVEVSDSERHVYLNGGGKGSNTQTTGTISADRVDVGRRPGAGSPSNYMNGRIAEVAIWSAALTDNEILSLARGISPMQIRPGSLISYNPLFGLTTPETDYSKNKHHFTNNGPTLAAHAPVRSQFSISLGWPGNFAPTGGTNFERLIVDEMFLQDQSSKQSDIVLVDRMLMPDVPVKGQEHILSEAMLIDDLILSSLERLRIITDKMFLQDQSINENEIKLIDRIVMSDASTKNQEQIILEKILLNDLMVSSLEGSRISTDKIYLLDAIIRGVDVFARGNILVDDTRKSEHGKEFRDDIFLKDASSSTIDYVMLDNLFTSDAVLLSKIYQAIITDGILALDSIDSVREIVNKDDLLMNSVAKRHIDNFFVNFLFLDDSTIIEKGQNITITDALFLLDIKSSIMEQLQSEAVLLRDARLSVLNLLSEDNIFLNDFHVLDLIKIFVEGLFISDKRISILDKIITTNLIVVDTIIKALELVATEDIFLSDSVTAEPTTGGLEVMATDTLVFLDNTLRIIESVTRDITPLSDKFIYGLDIRNVDSIMLRDSVFMGYIRELIDRLLVKDSASKAVALGRVDRLILNEVVSRIHEIMTREKIFIGDNIISVVIGAITETIVSARLRSVDFLGIRAANSDLLGRKIGFAVPVNL